MNSYAFFFNNKRIKEVPAMEHIGELRHRQMQIIDKLAMAIRVQLELGSMCQKTPVEIAKEIQEVTQWKIDFI